jgi:carbamoyltransferase
MDNQSIFSLYGGGHDLNVSIYSDNRLMTIEAERIFGNRYLSLELLSTQERLGIFNFFKKILQEEGLWRGEYNIGLVDWGTPPHNLKEAQEFFGLKEIHRFSHHQAHAAGAFYSSGFDEALVVSHDGGGDDGTFCVFDIKKSDPNFSPIHEYISNPFSTKYSTIGRFIEEIRPVAGSPLRQRLQKNSFAAGSTPLAHRRLQDLDQSVAGKIMGLSAYGSLNQDFLKRALNYFRHADEPNEECTPYSPAFWKNFGELAHSGVKDSEAYDLAFSVQRAFEEYFLELFSRYFDKEKHKNVCLTGGGALNVVLNEKLSKSYPFANFFVPSSPGDSGLSYGMLAHYLQDAGIPDTMYAGCPVIDKGSLPYILSGRPWEKATAALIAQELEKGKIIGVCRGASETGPRALGNRTILADPRNHKGKDIINSKVKFREWYRPFAPICKEDKASAFFETSPNASYKYMSFSPPVKKEYHKSLPAITHIDGSSRLQTISSQQNEFIYSILDEFEKLTGFPILINTSFNTKGKAILTRYLTALQVLDSTQLDAVILEDYYISK